MLKSFLLFTAVVLLVTAAASAPARPPQDASANVKSGAKLSPEAHARAKKLYELDCALCHGSSGDGKTDLAKDMQLTLIDWTDPKALSGMSDQALFDAIRKGKGKMPPEDEGRAKNDDIHYLVNYIRKFAQDRPATTVAPAAQPAAAPPTETAPATPPVTPSPSR
ncbi:MAG TPA: cytochrome c [Terracidiphilus sp.]|nr:cytochrome c [Terracidiphilus sp.]